MAIIKAMRKRTNQIEIEADKRDNQSPTGTMPERVDQSLTGRTESTTRIAERLAANRWTWRLASLGYAAKGLLYVIVGGTALLAAIKIGGRVRGTRGALNLLVSQPLGRVAVALVAAGLCGFILRRFVQIFVPPTIGTPPKKTTQILRRAGYALSGLANIGIALSALRLMFGQTALNSDQPPTSGWQVWLLVWKPLDGWLILAAGLAVIGIGVFHFYLAATRRFSVDLQTERMSRRMEKAVFAIGSAGYAGRGIAFLVIGAFLTYAGWFIEKIEPRGFGETLGSLETQPFGWWLLIIVAAGLAAYGLYLLLAARYLRLIATW